MSDNFRFAQLQPYSLAGAGAVAGATSITLKSMLDIDGNALSMSGTFGTIGFGTIEPGNGELEEQICFTGLVNNANGTTTLSGVSNVAFVYPYTQTSGLSKTHAGSTTFVISNTSGFYDELTSKSDDETITGTWTFTNPNYPKMDTATPYPTVNEQLATKAYADSLTFAGAPDATTTQKGIVELATQAEVDAKTATGGTGASLVATPALARSTLLSDYVADTGSANSYQIAPSPAISAYTTGQIFSFKATAANTTNSSLIVNGLADKSIRRLGGISHLSANDIKAGQIVVVEYDGTVFQLVGTNSNQVNFTGAGAYPAADGSSITGVNRKIYQSTGNITVANTGTLSTLYTTTLTGGTLGTNGAVRVRINFSAFRISTVTRTAVISLVYGSNSSDFTISAGAANSSCAGWMELDLYASGATNTQETSIYMVGSDFNTIKVIGASETILSFQANGTLATDSTTDQTLAVKIQFTTADADNNITTVNCLMERIV